MGNRGYTHPPKKQPRKSKKSWLLVLPELLKSASPAKKSVTKSKKSWLLRAPEPSQSRAENNRRELAGLLKEFTK